MNKPNWTAWFVIGGIVQYVLSVPFEVWLGAAMLAIVLDAPKTDHNGHRIDERAEW